MDRHVELMKIQAEHLQHIRWQTDRIYYHARTVSFVVTIAFLLAIGSGVLSALASM